MSTSIPQIPQDPQSGSFHTSELTRALHENSSFLSSYTMASSSPFATLQLLEEGQHIEVKVSEVGWEIIGENVKDAPKNWPPPSHTDREKSNIFPTLDELIDSVSPLARSKRLGSLFSKLEALQQTREGEE
ncbi:hypothetical protein BT69DRAFT_1275897 [Atractiella rhizophila]|nr:hypothetical protein BT69DRAFT_1275897 [Atractiella rhizophila]